ncbi:MAG: DsbA family protein [Gaiellaceae bacterium]
MTRNRPLLLAGAVGAAAVVAVVLILIGLESSSTSRAATPTTTQATSVPALSLAGIPQHGHTLGKPSAPVTLVVYEDPQCPYCRSWNVDTLPTVIDQFVRTGKIKLVYRGVEIIGPNSEPGLRAIYAAGEQNKLWNLADALYARQGVENSGWITSAVILAAAREAGANGNAIIKQMGSTAVTADLSQAAKQATADQLGGTPTFIVERPPAVAHQLAVPGLDPASFVPALTAALQG